MRDPDDTVRLTRYVRSTVTVLRRTLGVLLAFIALLAILDFAHTRDLGAAFIAVMALELGATLLLMSCSRTRLPGAPLE